MEQKHRYYVEMFHSPCLINDAKITQLPINLTDPSPNLHEEIQNSPNLTYEAMRFHNLLSLPHLLVRQTIEKKPFVDYSQSQIVISVKYLAILQQQKLNIAIGDNIREERRKEQEEKQAKKATEVVVASIQITQISIKRHAKA